MGEVPRNQAIELDQRINASAQYEGSAMNLKLRFGAYECAVDGRNVHNEIIDRVGMSEAQTILDVGCSDGEVLTNIRLKYGNNKRLIGLDIDDLYIASKTVLESEDMRPIEFLIGDATDIDLPDNSVDTALSLFMLYHIPNPEKALQEFKRVLKPGGELIVATSGKLNKTKHRKIEKALAKHLNVEPPPIFSSHFDSDIAADTLPNYFTVVNHELQQTPLVYTADNVEKYIFSLLTMYSVCKPIPAGVEWSRAIDEIAVPMIVQEMEQTCTQESEGYFTDFTDRHVFICKNIK